MLPAFQHVSEVQTFPNLQTLAHMVIDNLKIDEEEGGQVAVRVVDDGSQGKIQQFGQMHLPLHIADNAKMEGAMLITDLADSGNLLSHSAISARCHQQLQVKVVNTNIRA